MIDGWNQSVSSCFPVVSQMVLHTSNISVLLPFINVDWTRNHFSIFIDCQKFRLTYNPILVLSTVPLGKV